MLGNIVADGKNVYLTWMIPLQMEARCIFHKKVQMVEPTLSGKINLSRMLEFSEEPKYIFKNNVYVVWEDQYC